MGWGAVSRGFVLSSHWEVDSALRIPFSRADGLEKRQLLESELLSHPDSHEFYLSLHSVCKIHFKRCEQMSKEL
jgi:hypothetical protein